MIRTIVIVAALLGVSSNTYAQTVAVTPAGQILISSEVIDTGKDKALRMTVPVMVNGQGPFQFVIDTGADRSVISRELAQRLGLKEDGTATLHSIGGQSRVGIVKVDAMQVSTNIIRNMRIAALPATNIGADGLLGIDALKKQRIVMDFVAETMVVEPSTAPEAAIAPDDNLIIVTARTRLGQLVMVDADAGGEPISVVVDTGAQNSIANARLRNLLVKRVSGTTIKQIQLIDVLGRKTIADYTIVSKLRIGGVGLGNAAIAFAEAHPFKLFGLSRKPAMFLGVETLRLFKRVSIDFATRKVKFLLPGER